MSPLTRGGCFTTVASRCCRRGRLMVTGVMDETKAITPPGMVEDLGPGLVTRPWASG